MRSATSEPVGPRLQVAGPRLPAVEDVVHQPGAARLGQELGAEADQPARRHQVLQAHPAGRVVDHLLHPPLAHRERLGDDADVVLGHVDRQSLHRLVGGAVDLAGDDARLPRGQLEALAAHRLQQHHQLQLAAALDLPGVGPLGLSTLIETLPTSSWSRRSLDLARGQARAVLAGQGRGVDPDRDRERGLVDRDHRQRPRVLGVGERLADRHLLEAGDGDDLARPGLAAASTRSSASVT